MRGMSFDILNVQCTEKSFANHLTRYTPSNLTLSLRNDITATTDIVDNSNPPVKSGYSLGAKKTLMRKFGT